MITLVPLCHSCKHWHREDFAGFRCDAFPQGIPAPILESDHDHREPYPGDNGVRYEPAKPNKDP